MMKYNTKYRIVIYCWIYNLRENCIPWTRKLKSWYLCTIHMAQSWRI